VKPRIQSFHTSLITATPVNRFKVTRDRQWVIDHQNAKLLDNMIRIQYRDNEYVNELPNFTHATNFKRLQRQQARSYERF
jgi:hypothetical protein